MGFIAPTGKCTMISILQIKKIIYYVGLFGEACGAEAPFDHISLKISTTQPLQSMGRPIAA